LDFRQGIRLSLPDYLILGDWAEGWSPLSSAAAKIILTAFGRDIGSDWALIHASRACNCSG
jgi:hypothetical protein